MRWQRAKRCWNASLKAPCTERNRSQNGVDATKGIAGDSNPLSDILHYALGVFDRKNRDSYRADVEARLAECKMQALALVAQNAALG